MNEAQSMLRDCKAHVLGALGLVIGLSVVLRADDDAGRAAKGKALLAEIRDRLAHPEAQRATATCTLSEPVTGPHRAHGRRPCDYTRNLTLRNPQVTYNLRYWMNTGTLDGGDPVAIEGTSGLGMDKPSGDDWYGNNFLELTYGGQPILKTVLAEFAVTQAEGDTARAEVRWQTPAATVTLSVALAATASFLDVGCTVAAKGDPLPVRIGFRAYPGHAPPPRARRAALLAREVAAPCRLDLAPDEQALVLFDEHDANNGCGIRFLDRRFQAATLDLGDYGVTVSLDYAAVPVLESGLFRLWEYPHTPLNTIMAEVLGSQSGR